MVLPLLVQRLRPRVDDRMGGGVMARDYSKTNLTIWQDPEFRSLPWPAQHVYRMFWDHPGLSYCGVVDYRPARMLGWGAGWKRADFEALVACLRARHFLVVDETTEECLVRSWVRFDGILKQPRLAVSMANAFGEVGSNTIRGVIVSELHKLRDREPGAGGWDKPQVQDILGFPAVDAKTIDLPSDPFASGFEVGFGSASGSVSGSISAAFGPNATSGLGVGLGVAYNSNDTITTTPVHQVVGGEVLDETVAATASPTKKTSRRKPETRLPDDWQPTEQHMQKRRDGIDVEREAEKFRLHAEANDRRQVSWNAAFSQWLLNARPTPGLTVLRSQQDGPVDESLLPPVEDSWMRSSR